MAKDSRAHDIWPRGKRVLVQLDIPEETTKSGIVLPESVRKQRQEDSRKATVLAVGARANDDDADEPVAIGHRVLFSPFVGQKVPGSEDLLIILSEDIMAFLWGKAAKPDVR